MGRWSYHPMCSDSMLDSKDFLIDNILVEYSIKKIDGDIIEKMVDEYSANSAYDLLFYEIEEYMFHHYDRDEIITNEELNKLKFDIIDKFYSKENYDGFSIIFFFIVNKIKFDINDKKEAEYFIKLKNILDKSINIHWEDYYNDYYNEEDYEKDEKLEKINTEETKWYKYFVMSNFNKIFDKNSKYEKSEYFENGLKEICTYKGLFETLSSM